MDELRFRGLQKFVRFPPSPLGEGGATNGPWSVVFDVCGTPRPEPRPRSSRRSGRAYVPATADEWKHATRAAAVEALQQAHGWAPVPTSFAAWIEFRLERPAAHWISSRRGGRLRAVAPFWHTQRPDADNLAKSTLDALGSWSGLPPLLWVDDAQVAVATVTKLWAAEPGARVHVWGLP